MNYLHTPHTKIFRQFVNFRFIFLKIAASLFGLSLIVYHLQLLFRRAAFS